MEPFAALDCLLSEISFELLGNSVYDICGKQQDQLVNLFKAIPENNVDPSEESDLMKFIGYKNVDFIVDNRFCKAFLEDMFDSMLAENGYHGDGDFQNTLEIQQKVNEMCNNKKKFLTDSTEFQIKQTTEHSKMNTISNINLANVIGKETDFDLKDEAVQEYYENEKAELLTQSMDTIGLIDHILQDPNNQDKKTDLMAFIIASKKYLGSSAD